MEWKMEWNSEHTQLQLTCETGTAQSRLNCLVYLQGCYLTAKALQAGTALPTVMLLYPSMVIAVLQSQTLEQKIRVQLHKTIV